MKAYYFYDPMSGEFTGQSIATNKPNAEPFVEQNLPMNMAYMEFAAGNIKNYKVNVATGEIEPKTDITMTVSEIRLQIHNLREQYMATGQADLRTQIESLQNQLQNS